MVKLKPLEWFVSPSAESRYITILITIISLSFIKTFQKANLKMVILKLRKNWMTFIKK